MAQQKQDTKEKAQSKKAEDTKAKAETSQKEHSTEIPEKFQKLVKEIESLSTLDLSELVKVLEDHFGVSASVPAAAAAPAAAEGGEEAAEEQSEFTVTLKDSGSDKINVIKAVREITGEGLAESKALVEGAPKTVKENAPKEEADEAKQKLEDAGATVELS